MTEFNLSYLLNTNYIVHLKIYNFITSSINQFPIFIMQTNLFYTHT